MNRISTLKNSIMIATMILLPLAAVEASAQIKSETVDVPFAFTANHVSMPAGHYRVLESNSTLTFVHADTGRAQGMLLTRYERANSADWPGKLVFYVSGSRHVLTEVRFGGRSTYNVLLRQPKPERIAARNGQPENGTTIEIAMNEIK